MDTGEEQQHARGLAMARRTAKSVGTVAQPGGKAAVLGGRAAQASGKVATRAGATTTRAGIAMSGTGLGAVVGVPLALAGAGVAGAGATAQAGGAAMQAGGKVAERSGGTIRRALSLSRLRKKKSKPTVFNKIAESKLNPMHLATARALQASWFAAFIGIFSFGVTTLFALLYMHVHLLGRIVFPHVFAKFGTEWMPLKSRALHTPSKFLGALEIVGILFIDVIIIAIALMISTFVVMIIAWVSNNPITSYFIFNVLPVLREWIPGL